MTDAPRIYPDSLASRIAIGTAYRPSNWTEGEIFMEHYCFVCQRHADFRNGGDSCPIAALTMALDRVDPDYPKEWNHGPDGQPRCTAFVPEGEKVPDPRCPNTPDMFGDSP